MGILDGVVEWIAEQVMNILDMINTSVLGALGCDMETFLRYFPVRYYRSTGSRPFAVEPDFSVIP